MMTATLHDTCPVCNRPILAGANAAFRGRTSLHLQCYLNEVAETRSARDGPGALDQLLEDVHVLIVEDDQLTLEMLRATLESFGAEVTSAVDVRSGRIALHADTPHVLVSDISMPHDGFEIVREVIAYGASTGLKVPAVAITASDTARDRMRMAGFSAVLAKPFDPFLLAAVVAGLANRRRGPVIAGV